MKVTKMARSIVRNFGMSDKLGLIRFNLKRMNSFKSLIEKKLKKLLIKKWET